MKTILPTIALCLALPALAAAPAAAPAPARAAAGKAAEIAAPAAFADALEACTVSRHAAPHPFMRTFTIEHAIAGERDGACAYSQTMPGEMRMECRLSKAGRSDLAGDLREQAQGRMSGGTGRQPAWSSQCEIVTKDGKRSPIGGR